MMALEDTDFYYVLAPLDGKSVYFLETIVTTLELSNSDEQEAVGEMLNRALDILPKSYDSNGNAFIDFGSELPNVIVEE